MASSRNRKRPKIQYSEIVMTSELGFTLCRIASVYFFVTALRGISWISVKAFMITSDISDFALGLLFTSAPAAVAGILLWRYSDRISTLPEKPEKTAMPMDLTTGRLLEAGVFLVGLYAVLIGLVEAINNEAIDWMARSKPDTDSNYQSQVVSRNWARRAGYLLQITLRIVLIYWRNNIAAFAQKHRRAK